MKSIFKYCHYYLSKEFKKEYYISIVIFFFSSLLNIIGVASLLPFVARTDIERRILINCIGPTWEGNQVWFILGGGAIFAAWPMLYAISFSGFYLAMLVILLALILRPVGFKYRSKLSNAKWRSTWDWALFIGGFVPSLIFLISLLFLK